MLSNKFILQRMNEAKMLAQTRMDHHREIGL